MACTEDQIPDVKVALEKLWQSEALREDPPEKEIVTPRSGGSRGVMDMGFDDNEDWKDLSSDDSSSDSEQEDDNKSKTDKKENVWEQAEANVKAKEEASQTKGS